MGDHQRYDEPSGGSIVLLETAGGANIAFRIWPRRDGWSPWRRTLQFGAGAAGDGLVPAVGVGSVFGQAHFQPFRKIDQDTQDTSDHMES